jgi:hypothetical protein
MPNEINVDPRYLKYSKAEVERLLDKVDSSTIATEEDVRNIVNNYFVDDEPAPEEQSDALAANGAQEPEEQEEAPGE